jgi:protocatechuate 3,4-dioxygenase beta subunit
MTQPLDRRRILARGASVALVALPWAWTGARAQAAAPLRPTPSQTEGPFYPVEFPADADADLLRNGALAYTQGDEAWVEGQVRDLSGAPIKGAVVEIWQCDHNGYYHHPGNGGRADKRFQGFGRATAQADGSYRFHTIRPTPYVGRAPHIHVKVVLGTKHLLTTQLYVAGHEGNERDSLLRRLDAQERKALVVPFTAAAPGQALRAVFPIVVET